MGAKIGPLLDLKYLPCTIDSLFIMRSFFISMLLVIQETLRTASILSFTFREAVEDVHLQGYLIPKGWKMLPVFRSIHHCAEFFPHPEKFDPSRFEVPLRPNTFMPFGNGVHSCPGNELAKLEMLILLHHLTAIWILMI